MTISEIANYCQFKNCRVTLGNEKVGYILVDGEGRKESSNYRRFLEFNELSASPRPEAVLAGATVFKVQRHDGEKTFTRDQFEEECRRFEELVQG